MPKDIGGTDAMHIKPDKHPFTSKFKSTHKLAMMSSGTGASPGGKNSYLSANSVSKKSFIKKAGRGR